MNIRAGSTHAAVYPTKLSRAHPCIQVVLKLIQPYTRIRIPFVSQQLNIPEADVEQLLVMLILDNRINGHIDQVDTSLPSLCNEMHLYAHS